MRGIVYGILAGIVVSSGICLADTGSSRIKDEQGRINYSIGYQMGGDFKKQGLRLDTELLLQGMRDAMANGTPLLSAEQMNTTLVNLKKKLTADQAAGIKQRDAAFLAENAAKPGVVVLPSGVQYRVIKDGTGRKPSPTDSVTIKYQVSRTDGSGIASGYPEGTPRTYPMEKALPGLREVLQLMKEGAVWQVVLPPKQAVVGSGDGMEHIGVLVYSLELVSVQPAKQGSGPQG